MKHWPCLVVIGAYLLCISIADPRGEFPLNDDWSYSRSAFSAASGHLKVDQWSAPSLVGQAIFGGFLARIFSPRFLVLRISTLFLSCCTVLLLWGILIRSGCRRGPASVLLLAWIFNPLQFGLAFTFMTEVPFLFFVALSVYLFVRYMESKRVPTLLLSAASLGYAYLIRQSALLLVAALVCTLLLGARKRTRFRDAFLVVCTAGTFIAAYHAWVLTRGGATAAVQKKFALLQHLNARQVIGNSYGMLFYLAFLLVPVWLFLVPRLVRMMREVHPVLRIGIPVVLATTVLIGLFWFYASYRPGEYLPSASYHSRMPFLLNVLYDSGIGPITLEPDYYGAPPTPVHPGIWRAVTVVTATGAVVSLCLCLFGLMRNFSERKPLIFFSGFSFLFLAAFEIVFSHIQEGGLFDRHILIVSFPFLLLLWLLSGNNEELPVRRWYRAFPEGIALAVLAVFCVAATHDYMEWNRIRWDMGRGLLAQGVDPLTIVGGFEFNAWNNYDTFAARGNIAKVYYWWYDRRDYIISMSPQNEYEVRSRREYFSWVHLRSVSLYLLHLGTLPH